MLNLKEAVLKAVPVLVEIAAPAVVEMEQEEEESTPQPGEEEGPAPRHTRQALRRAVVNMRLLRHLRLLLLLPRLLRLLLRLPGRSQLLRLCIRRDPANQTEAITKKI